MDRRSTLDPIPTVSKVVALLAACATGAAAQSLSFEPPRLLYTTSMSASDASTLFSGDLSGNGFPDVVLEFAGLLPFYNQGDGPFDLGAALSPSATAGGCVALDFDGDVDVDFAGLANSPPRLLVFRNQGAGTFAPPASIPGPALPTGLAAGDLNGDGFPDLVTTDRQTDTLRVFLNQGDGTFVASSATYAAGQGPWRPALGDIHADGILDVLVPDYDGNALLAFRGLGDGTFQAAFRYTLPTFQPSTVSVGDFDEDGRDDVILTLRQFTQNYVATMLQVPAGGLGAADVRLSECTSGLPVITDIDADGHLDFLACRCTVGVYVLRGTGAGTWTPTSGLPSGTDFAGASGQAVVATDFDGDGDVDVVLGGTAIHPGRLDVVYWRNHMASGAPFCIGDGSATACPCGNASPVGSGTGCLNTLNLGARLRGHGSSTITKDELVLEAAQMPGTSPALYFQGSEAIAAGAGAVFGDGLRCAGGSIVRLGVKANAGGASSYPGAGDPPISVRGAASPGEAKNYQVWYRNVAPFCTPSGFNLSNGLRVVWRM